MPFLPTMLAPLVACLCGHAAALPGVVYLRSDPDGVGTGWVVDAEKKLVLTCRHVVGEQTKLEVFFPRFRAGRVIAESAEYLGRRAPLRESGALVTGKVVRTSDELDLALVELPSLPPGTRALPLADGRRALGQPVWSVGHRGDLDTLWNATAGTVRARGQLADGYFWQSKKLALGLPCLVLQSPIEGGDSGGPVLNGRGEVVAMVSALRRRAPLAAVGPDAAAIRIFLKRPEPPAEGERSAVEGVARSTVWLRPTATEMRCAGMLIDRGRRLVLTSAAGVGPLDRIGATFPLLTKAGEIVAESAAYKDGVELHLAKRWHVGTVLHRDPRRDLALVQLDSIPDGVEAVALADRDPAMLEGVFAVSHPLGLEFAFVASSGTLRQRGNVALVRDERAAKPDVNLFQLPATSASPGGPICNGRGELLGVQAAKDGPPQQGYAASLSEVRAFLAEAPGAALLRNMKAVGDELDTWGKFVGGVRAAEGARLQRAGRAREAAAAFGAALQAHPGCVAVLFGRATLRAVEKDWPGVLADCDSILAKQPQHWEALFLRASAKSKSKDAKAAIGDLQRRLDTMPDDVAFRTALVKCHEAAGDGAKAAEERKKIARLKGAPR